MSWTRLQWTDHGEKHMTRGPVDIDVLCERTREGRPPVSKYQIPREQIEFLELSTVDPSRPDENGRLIYQRKAKRLYYKNCGDVIGASRGEPTSLIVVEWHRAGHVHGYPVTEGELIEKLSRFNTDELQRYRARRQ